jgi:CDP-6-deoxy-D-xylo-4-hexulose-3-dehydrase
MRAHGWSRSPYSYKKIAKQNPNLDPRFIFTNMGFNLRSTDIQAAIGLNQFKRLDHFSKKRKINRHKIINGLKKSKNWSNQFSFLEVPKKIDPSWFSLVILISDKLLNKKKKFIKYLTNKGIETRPIISGNFTNQPAVKLFDLNPKNIKFPNADKIEKKGFFLGLKTENISNTKLNYLIKNLLKIDEI